MAASIYPVSTQISVTLRESAGIANGSFTKQLYRNGSTSAETVTVTEDGTNSGLYHATFTPVSNGWYALWVKPASVTAHWWVEEFIVGDSIVTLSEIWAKVCETEGSYTAQQILSIMLSAVAGRTSNNGLTFKTPNNNATRIDGTVDSNDNRTAITLTPSA